MNRACEKSGDSPMPITFLLLPPSRGYPVSLATPEPGSSDSPDGKKNSLRRLHEPWGQIFILDFGVKNVWNVEIAFLLCLVYWVRKLRLEIEAWGQIFILDNSSFNDLIDLVNLVDLVCLVSLVYFICFVDRVSFIGFVDLLRRYLIIPEIIIFILLAFLYISANCSSLT